MARILPVSGPATRTRFEHSAPDATGGQGRKVDHMNKLRRHNPPRRHGPVSRMSLAAVAVTAAVVVGACDEPPVNAPQAPPAVVQGWKAADDEGALRALFRATGGSAWVRKDNWLIGNDLGDWYGVTVDTAGRVTALHLSNNGLAGPIPRELGALTHLEVLRLDGNSLAGPMPTELSRLGRLRELSVTDLAGAPSPIPRWLERLTALERLDLSGNQLTGSVPDWIRRLERLEHFDLSDNHLRGEISAEIGSLVGLKTLRARNNALAGPVPTGIGKMSGLRILDLGSNHLAGSIPKVLGTLEELIRLDLGRNALGGRIPKELGELAQLEHLDLGGNALGGAIPRELGKLSALSFLSLRWNSLSGAIPPDMGNLSALVRLDMRGNSLRGNLPDDLGRMAKLEVLDLSLNSLVGPVPLELTTLPALKKLDLGDNGGVCVPHTPRFTRWLHSIGEANAPQCRGDRAVLVALHGSTGGASWTRQDNWDSEKPLGEWHGVTTDSATGRVTALKLANNNVVGRLDRRLAGLAALRHLDLSRNALTGPIPTTLTQVALNTLNLDGTRLCAPSLDTFASWLATVETSSGADIRCPPLTDRDILVTLYEATGGKSWLKSDQWLTRNPLGQWHGVTVDGTTGRVTALELSYNELSGQVPPELGGLTSLENLSLSGNDLAGPLPKELGDLAALEYLDVAFSGLVGPLPPELARLTVLESLVLSGNELSGPIPAELGRLARLETLSLASNSLSGPIPEELGNLARLESLNLEHNRLSGSIPEELGRLAKLETLGLQNNRLAGGLPRELEGLETLYYLDVSGNDLSGPIPGELGELKELRQLVASHNRLSGRVPPRLGQLEELSDLNLSNNALSGPIPPELGSLKSVARVDLSHNSLSGPIPASLGGLSGLRDLHLAHNKLQGELPGTLGNLRQLGALDLSSNQLSGAIPGQIGRVEFLGVLSLSRNKLSGPIPGELSNLGHLRYIFVDDNPGLTGPLPGALTSLKHIFSLNASGTDLCAPADAQFQAWLDKIIAQHIRRCADKANLRADAYLVQAVQGRDHPVPLVAGREALLRVFLATRAGTSETMPAVRATFYNGQAVTHRAEMKERQYPLGSVLREDLLEASVNISVPGRVLQPGTEVVIDIDPDGNLDPALGIPTRIPDRGRLKLDIRTVPDFDLTVVPFLWTDDPDSTILAIAGGMAKDPHRHEMLADARDLLPVKTLDVVAHKPVLTSTNNGVELLHRTHALWAMEGGDRYYKGMIAGPVAGGIGGVAYLWGQVSFSRPRARIVAHELGHNLGLAHAPCGLPQGVDPSFPDNAGRSGAWGYDWKGKELVPPFRPDFMSYCEPAWVSDYHFGNALRHRLSKEKTSTRNVLGSRESALLLWGGIDQDGAPVLNPAFAADLPPLLPVKDGPWRLWGVGDDGAVLFELGFEMAVALTDGYRGGGFAFSLPVDPLWADQLARLTLTGPGRREVVMDRSFDRPMAILLESATGQIRGFLEGSDLADLGWPVAAGQESGDAVAPGVAQASSASRLLLDAGGVRVLTSRGLPWNR